MNVKVVVGVVKMNENVMGLVVSGAMTMNEWRGPGWDAGEMKR